MPADADPNTVFSAKDLLDMSIGAIECFDLRDDSVQPSWYRLGSPQLAGRIVIAESERSHPSLSLELPELKRLKRKILNPGDELPLRFRRHEFGRVAQSVRLQDEVFKKCKLLRQAFGPSTCKPNDIGLLDVDRKARLNKARLAINSEYPLLKVNIHVRTATW